MHSKNCLNCNEPVHKNFCENCGQKTDTHRITLSHFLMHDLLHGVWHFEKGIFFTLKEAISRPGKAALDYLAGKRIRYYNVFYLALLLIGACALLHLGYRHFAPVDTNPDGAELNHMLAAYSKLFVFGIVPLLALNARVFFGRVRLNLAEHFVIAGMALLGILMLTCLFLVFMTLGVYTEWDFLQTGAALLFPILILLSPLWTYLNAFSDLYSVPGIIWRSVAFIILVLIQLVVVFVALVSLMATNGDSSVNLTF